MRELYNMLRTDKIRFKPKKELGITFKNINIKKSFLKDNCVLKQMCQAKSSFKTIVDTAIETEDTKKEFQSKKILFKGKQNF